jgi:hypothetical protein
MGYLFLLKFRSKNFWIWEEGYTYITRKFDCAAEQGFLRIISLANTGVTSFPKSYWDAARVAFPDNPEMQDDWTGQW